MCQLSLGDRVADHLCVTETLKEKPERQYGETAEVDECRRNITAARQEVSAYLFLQSRSLRNSRSQLKHMCSSGFRAIRSCATYYGSFGTSICPSEANSMSIARSQNADLQESDSHYLFRIGCWGRSRRVAGRLKIRDHRRRPQQRGERHDGA